ncbi:MAG: carboxylesterase family protein [Bacteroidales bacterium]|nr:carboxylesterase family protein [Bacteroidales bacterium]
MKLDNKLILILVWLFPILLFAATPQKQTYTYINRDSEPLKLDIYTTYTSEVQPCLIFVFGGGFKEGTRDTDIYKDYFEYFANKGFTVASIDYRLGMKGEKAPSMFNYKPMEHSIELAVEDLYAATHFLLENAYELNIDTTQILISGSSAGAIAVLQADYEKRNSFESANILPSQFQYTGVIAFSGCIFSKEGAPTYTIAPAPTLLFHGSADKLVPYNNTRFFNIGMFGSNTLAKEFRKNEYPYLFYSMEENGHEVAEYPMTDFLPEIDQFISDYIFNKKQLLIDINYRDKNRVVEISDSPKDYYNN